MRAVVSSSACSDGSSGIRAERDSCSGGVRETVTSDIVKLAHVTVMGSRASKRVGRLYSVGVTTTDLQGAARARAGPVP